MRRLHVALLGLALALLACGESATVTTEANTTSAAPVATTVPVGPTAIPTSEILKLAVGESYSADSFWIPLSITPDAEGWWSLGAGELWIYLQWHEGGSSLFDLDVVVLAHAPNAAVDVVVAAIAVDEAIEVTAEPAPTTVAGREGVVLDVVALGDTDEEEERNFRGHSRTFSALMGLTLLVEEDPVAGRTGSVGSTLGYGVRRGRAARIWVLDVAGSTITVVAAAADLEVFGDLAPVADRLVAGIDLVP